MSKTDEKENGDPKRKKLPKDHLVKAKEMHTIRYAFTAEELLEKAKKMSAANSKIDQLEDDLKAAKTDFTARIAAEKSVITMNSNHLNNGYENRNVECDVTKDFEKGAKTYSYQGVTYDTVPLTNSDRQTELSLLNNAPISGVKEPEPSPALAEQDED